METLSKQQNIQLIELLKNLQQGIMEIEKDNVINIIEGR